MGSQILYHARWWDLHLARRDLLPEIHTPSPPEEERVVGWSFDKAGEAAFDYLQLQLTTFIIILPPHFEMVWPILVCFFLFCFFPLEVIKCFYFNA